MKKYFGTKKAILLLTVFIDVLGIGIIIPVLPYYVSDFGASAFVVAALFAVFSFLSFFSAPLLGALSDKIGRRPVLMISLFSTSIGWLVFAWAPNILWLFIGRIIDGLAAGNFVVAQSYLLDLAHDKKERTASLGLIGAMFGIGMIIGPAIAGPLSEIRMWLPFALVGGLALLNTLFVWLYLPESRELDLNHPKISFNPFGPLVKAFKTQSAKANLWAWFLFNIAISLQQAILALYFASALGFDASQASVFLTAIGVLIVLNQGFLLRKFWLKIMPENKLQYLMLIMLAAGLALMAPGYFWLTVVALVLTTFGQGVLRAVLTSQIVKHYPKQGNGEILGVANALASLAVVIGPLIGGYLFLYGFSWPFVLAGLITGLAVLVLLCFDKKEATEEEPDLLNFYVPKNL